MALRTIGQLAKDAGVGVETIRYYERIGLLVRPDSARRGWRKYGDVALWTVRYIKQAQQLGFSLTELSALIRTSSRGTPVFCQSMRSAWVAKIELFDQEIARLTAQRSTLVEFIEDCRKRGERGKCPILENLGRTQLNL